MIMLMGKIFLLLEPRVTYSYWASKAHLQLCIIPAVTLKLGILSTQPHSVCEFCMILTANSDGFHKQLPLLGHCNGNTACLLYGTNCNYRSCLCYWHELRPYHGSDVQSPDSHSGGPGSIPGQSIWDEEVTLGEVFLGVLWFFPVSIIPPMLHNHLHLQAVLTKRTNGQRLGALKNPTLIRKPESIGEKSNFTYLEKFCASKI